MAPPAETTIPRRRLAAQWLSAHAEKTPAEVVAWLGAVQAQDYAGVKWAVGLRMGGGASDEELERALAEGTILRTHAMRWTWQLVAPADLRWLLRLVAPRLMARYATRHRELGIDAALLRRTFQAWERALADGRHRTRAEMGAALRHGRVAAEGPRLAHLLGCAELEGLLTSGARRGKQNTYALLEARVPPDPVLRDRDAALAELALRYFRSRGPATAADFAWWSGLTLAETRRGLEAVGRRLTRQQLGGVESWSAAGEPPAPRDPRAHLLPPFDEYLVSYKDRAAVLAPEHVKRVNAGGGLLNPCVVLDGRVVGLWRRTLGASRVLLELDLFSPMGPRLEKALGPAIERLGAFLGRPAELAEVTVLAKRWGQRR